MCVVQDSSLFVLPFCFARFECYSCSMNILYINSVWWGCFFCFNYFIPTISQLPFHHCIVCCRRFFVKICPHFAQFFVLSDRFFLCWSLGEYILVFFCLFYFLYSLLLSFFLHFMLVLRFDHFRRVADGFICSLPFLFWTF